MPAKAGARLPYGGAHVKKKGNRLLRYLTAICLVALLCQGLAALAADTVKVYLNFNYQGAPSAQEAYVESGKTLDKPADPSREGYRFTGWYTNVVCNKAYDFSAPVTQNMRLFAGWEPTEVTVTFRLRTPGTDDVQVKAAVGSTVALPDVPSRDGFEFGGWFANAACTKAFDETQAIGARNAIVYAKWIQEQAVITYVISDDETVTMSAEFGKALAAPADPTREGYAFEGWYTALAGGEKYDFTKPVTENARIYAHWTQTSAIVTFDANFDGGEKAEVAVEIGKAVEEAPTLTRTGYEFTQWYADAAATKEYDLTTAVTENMTLFAGWQKKELTVTFDPNYEGGKTETATALYQETVTAPKDPTRDGFDFTGWYLDKEATKLFNAANPVEEEMTVYAGWLSQAEASGDRIYTYLLNYGENETYETQKFTSTKRVKAPDAPTRAGYYFAGWARDPEGTILYDFSSERSTRSTTLYAKWLKGYTFEGEYTFMDGKPGQGSSDNCMGTDIIQGLKDVLGNGTQMGMSNGYYVGKLYYNGAFVEFDITSSKEVTDAVLVVRLTPDLYDMYFTDETYRVTVNDERIEYGKLNLDGAIAQTDFDELGNAINGDMNKRPFENYVLTTSLHLLEGNNHIVLTTNNKNDHGGTFNADTPLLDCLYIYSNSEVSWTKCYPQNVGQTMDDVSYEVTYDTEAK